MLKQVLEVPESDSTITIYRENENTITLDIEDHRVKAFTSVYLDVAQIHELIGVLLKYQSDLKKGTEWYNV